MAKVTNLTEKAVRLHHWKIPGKGVVEMPDSLAYSRAAKVMADGLVLELEGYVVPQPAQESPLPVMTFDEVALSDTVVTYSYRKRSRKQEE